MLSLSSILALSAEQTRGGRQLILKDESSSEEAFVLKGERHTGTTFLTSILQHNQRKRGTFCQTPSQGSAQDACNTLLSCHATCNLLWKDTDDFCCWKVGE